MLSVTGSGGKTVASHDKFRAIDSVKGGWGDSRAFVSVENDRHKNLTIFQLIIKIPCVIQ